MKLTKQIERLCEKQYRKGFQHGFLATKNWVIVPVGVIILLGAFKISVTTGFALAIGLCVGSLVEKLKQYGRT
jgi:hypothetical protein